MSNGLRRGQLVQPCVGQRDPPVGQGGKQAVGVGLGQPQDPGSGTGHGAQVLQQRGQGGGYLAGGLGQGNGEAVAQDTASAQAAVVLPALGPAASAGEVAQSAGAVGTEQLPGSAAAG